MAKLSELMDGRKKKEWRRAKRKKDTIIMQIC
jgi:hypothetical protein